MPSRVNVEEFDLDERCNQEEIDRTSKSLYL